MTSLKDLTITVRNWTPDCNAQSALGNCEWALSQGRLEVGDSTSLKTMGGRHLYTATRTRDGVEITFTGGDKD